MGLEPNYIVVDGQTFSKTRLALDNDVQKNSRIDSDFQDEPARLDGRLGVVKRISYLVKRIGRFTFHRSAGSRP